MTIEEAAKLRPGDEVYWNDPALGWCSKLIQIIAIDIQSDGGIPVGDDAVIWIECDDGGELECYACELEEIL